MLELGDALLSHIFTLFVSLKYVAHYSCMSVKTLPVPYRRPRWSRSRGGTEERGMQLIDSGVVYSIVQNSLLSKPEYRHLAGVTAFSPYRQTVTHPYRSFTDPYRSLPILPHVRFNWKHACGRIGKDRKGSARIGKDRSRIGKDVTRSVHRMKKP